MHKFLLLLTICLILAISAGCVTTAGPAPVSTPTPALPPTVTETATAVKTTTAIPTTIKTAIPTTPAPTKPLNSEVTLTGRGSSIVSFTTVAPGKVSITWTAAPGQKVQPCSVTRKTVHLSGASFDSDLNAQKSVFNLITPGTYKLQVKDCYGWKITVDNA